MDHVKAFLNYLFCYFVFGINNTFKFSFDKELRKTERVMSKKIEMGSAVMAGAGLGKRGIVKFIGETQVSYTV